MNSAIRKNIIGGSQSAIALALVDGCWLYITVWMLTRIGLGFSVNFSLPQPLVLAALEVGGWAVASAFLERGGFSERTLRVAMSLLGLALGLALSFAYNPIPSELSTLYFLPFLTTLFLVLGVWMLGGFHATEIASYDRLYNEFRLGMIMIAVSALMATLFARASVNSIWSEIGGVALLFFGAGLAGLALSNRDVVRHETGDAGLRSWGLFVVASVGAILLLGVLAQGIGQGDIVGAFQNVVLGVVVVIGGLIFGVITLIVWPLSWLNIHIDVPTTPPPQQTPVPQTTPVDPFADLRRQYGGPVLLDLPPEWKIILVAIACAVIVALVVFLMSRWLRNTRRDKDLIQGEEHEQFGSWGLFIEQLKAWLLRLLARFRHSVPAAEEEVEDDLSSLAGKAGWEGTLSVRQIYVHLLRAARSAGYPRAPQQTSTEYLGVLSEALPDSRPELQAITAAYIEARYGPHPASALAVHSANEAWRKIEALVGALGKADAGA